MQSENLPHAAQAVPQSGKRNDIVLEAGQSLRIEGDERVIVSALHAAELTLDETCQRAWQERQWRKLRALYLGWRRRSMHYARRRGLAPRA